MPLDVFCIRGPGSSLGTHENIKETVSLKRQSIRTLGLDETVRGRRSSCLHRDADVSNNQGDRETEREREDRETKYTIDD